MRSISMPTAAITIDGEQDRRPIGPAEHGARGQPEERAEHHQVALREVDRLGRLVDQHEAERDERVHAALRDACKSELQELAEHAPSPVSPTLIMRGFFRTVPSICFLENAVLAFAVMKSVHSAGRSLAPTNRRRIVMLKDRYDALWQPVIDELNVRVPYRAMHTHASADLRRCELGRNMVSRGWPAFAR